MNKQTANSIVRRGTLTTMLSYHLKLTKGEVKPLFNMLVNVANRKASGEVMYMGGKILHDYCKMLHVEGNYFESLPLYKNV